MQRKQSVSLQMCIVTYRYANGIEKQISRCVLHRDLVYHYSYNWRAGAADLQVASVRDLGRCVLRHLVVVPEDRVLGVERHDLLVPLSTEKRRM